ncbi:MAG: phosphoribosyltransferase family protein [Iamia sp.]
MLLATRCGICDRPGASPCRSCHARLRAPAPDADPPGLPGLVALLRYDGPARDLVARIKYRNQRQAVAWLADGLAALLAGVRIDMVTWAPTTPEHRRRRGFDHGEVLARAVARRLRRPARPLLRRVRGPAQTGRDAQHRREVPPEFATTDDVPAGTCVLVVDDVVTTGATLRAATTALGACGAVVRAAAAARTPPPGTARTP